MLVGTHTTTRTNRQVSPEQSERTKLMKDMKRKDVIRMLSSEGYVSSAVGEHEIFMNAQGVRIPLPQHKVISPGTLRDIMKRIKAAKLTLVPMRNAQ